jgi:hypothetical protein
MSTADAAATPLTHSDPPAAARPRPTFFSRMVTRYVDGWTWYARSGWAPPAPEPGYPMRRPAADAEPCCIELRGSAPASAPRFALLFGAAAGGR